MKYKTKQTLKQIVSILLLCCVGFGAVVGISAISKKLNSDDKTIHPTFSVGSITSAGKGDSSDKSSIYTKDAFECKGLKVELDFDATVRYQAFFYDELGNYISNSATEKYDESEDLSAVIPTDAVYARLVVTPDDDEDGEIKWYEVSKYSSQLTVKVLRDQTEPVNEELEAALKGAKKQEYKYYGSGALTLSNPTPAGDDTYFWYGYFDATKYDEIIIKCQTGALTNCRLYNFVGNGTEIPFSTIITETLYEEDGYSWYSVNAEGIEQFLFFTLIPEDTNTTVWLR